MTVLQRPVKGSRISSFYPVKTVPQLSSLDSAFQLQEYISLLIRSNVHDVDTIVSIPGKSSVHDRAGSDGSDKGEDKDGKSDVTVDEASWIYEQLRRLAQDLSHPLITTLQQECTRATCPEMKAGEWLYLCVAHGSDGAMEQCCAIDYILHTLDSATALLNSPRAFPSRLSVPAPSTRHFSSLARRLGRIFAHAYYHHREAFEQAEAESSLYARFLALTSKFDLVPNEFLVIPPRSAAVSEEGEEESGQEYPSRNLSEASQRLENERDWLTSTTGIEPRTLRGISPPGPAGEARNPSPRKGRSRTDTMVYSEAINVAEELAKGEGFTEADLDKAISQERLLSTIEPTSADTSALTSEPEGSSAPEAPGPTAEPAAETDKAPPHPTEIQLEIAAPPPAEPAFPSDSGDSQTADESDDGPSAEASEETILKELEEPEAEVAEASSEAAQESDVTDNAEDASEPLAEAPAESSSEAAEHTDEAPAPTAESDIGTSEVPKDEAAEPSPAPESAPEAEPKELPSTDDIATTPADPEHDKPSDSDG